MSRNDFAEIMRFIRFNKKSERSKGLRTNKFAMVSRVNYGANLQRIHKIVINLVHTLLLYKELREKEPCNKTINTLRFIATKRLVK